MSQEACLRAVFSGRQLARASLPQRLHPETAPQFTSGHRQQQTTRRFSIHESKYFATRTNAKCAGGATQTKNSLDRDFGANGTKRQKPEATAPVSNIIEFQGHRLLCYSRRAARMSKWATSPGVTMEELRRAKSYPHADRGLNKKRSYASTVGQKRERTASTWCQNRGTNNKNRLRQAQYISQIVQRTPEDLTISLL